MKNMLKLISLLICCLTLGSVSAVHLSPDGSGQVIVFPYYTINNSFATLVTVTNVDLDHAKAARLAVREANNGRAVALLNIYLNPGDTWSGVISESDGFPVLLQGADGTCTFPKIPAEGIGFSNELYFNDGGVSGIERSREGFIEVIEIGLAVAEEDFSDCDQIVKNWQNGERWDSEPLDGFDANTNGSLVGQAILADILGGRAFITPPVVMDDLFVKPVHKKSTSDNISLNSSVTAENSRITDMFFENGVEALRTVEFEFDSSIDAVTSLFMYAHLKNHFFLDDAIAARTDLIINMPTKRFYTDPDIVGNVPLPPFDHLAFDNECNRGLFSAVDRAASVDVLNAKMPLCNVTNVFSLNKESILGTAQTENVLEGLPENGWFNIDLVVDGENPGLSLGGINNKLDGLPAQAVIVQSLVNGTLGNGNVLANYSVAEAMKAQRNIILL